MTTDPNMPPETDEEPIEIEGALAVKPTFLSQQHWNGNQMVVVDVETTGLEVGFHEIWQLAAIALDSNLNIRKDVKPLDMLMCPENPERIDWTAPVHRGNKDRIQQAMRMGCDQERGKDILKKWLDSLGLPHNKGGFWRCKVYPLGHNIAQFDVPFIQNWLGISQYGEWFHPYVRDTMQVAIFLNDRAGAQAEKVPFSKLTLRWLAKRFDVELPEVHEHNALYDCKATANLYRELVFRGLFR